MHDDVSNHSQFITNKTLALQHTYSHSRTRKHAPQTHPRPRTNTLSNSQNFSPLSHTDSATTTTHGQTECSRLKTYKKRANICCLRLLPFARERMKEAPCPSVPPLHFLRSLCAPEATSHRYVHVCVCVCVRVCACVCVCV